LVKVVGHILNKEFTSSWIYHRGTACLDVFFCDNDPIRLTSLIDFVSDKNHKFYINQLKDVFFFIPINNFWNMWYRVSTSVDAGIDMVYIFNSYSIKMFNSIYYYTSI